MIQTGIESRVKIQDIISNQLPEFVLAESPKAVDFLKQYYISQEYQGGPVDIVENLDEYLKVDNLTPDVVVGFTSLSSNIDTNDTTITVSTTKGFPNQYGLLKIDSEIITYTGLTTNTFTGCVRGFSGITSYHSDLNEEELVFSTSTAASHASGVSIQNLSSLFLKEFYRKLKTTYTPGFEDRTFDPKINVGNFIKEARSFYESKGTDDSFRILFNVLFGETPKVINLEDYLIKPSDAEFIRREICVAEVISGDPAKIVGQTLTKTTDDSTLASISSVEAFTRDLKQYFKIGLFVGFSDNSSVQGNFTITPSSKVLENVSVGSSVISVDSTIGFGQTGTLYSGSNVITYSDKSVNQFLGCSGITSSIAATDNIHSNDTYFAYEDGDATKKVVLRLTGVLSNFVQKSKSVSVSEGDILTVKNVGTLVRNPEQNKTYKEIFTNSWIYNTSSSVNIDNISGSSVTLKTVVDRSQFKKGDLVEFIDLTTDTVVFPTESSSKPYISSNIPFNSKSLSIQNLTGFLPNPSRSYKLRRKINKANSSVVPFKYGNDSIISDVQNVYLDGSDFAYVASNSLPSWGNGFDNNYSYQITKKLNSSFISATSGSLSDLDPATGLYTSIEFDLPVTFISGERVQYTPSGSPLNGLSEGPYYVKVLSNPKKIKLFTSNSFLSSDANALQFISSAAPLETHTFTLYSQKSNSINPQKVFKKFTLNPNVKNGIGEETVPGSTGMLINGVEISNYKTFDRIYSGPIEEVTVLNPGSDFDVISPPILEVSAGLGTTALVQPVVTGSIQEIFVDKQDFDIKEVLSINATGGNVSGGSFEPVTIVKRREVLFDGRATTEGGGISTTTSQLTFLSNHNFTDGEEITYRNNGNANISIGLGVSALVDNKNYFAKVDNSTTIQLFNTFNDFQTSSNVVSFGTTTLSGTHKFLTGTAKKTLSEVKVIDGGKLTNRKLLVKPSGISTSQNLINFTNHGFSSGELVEYNSVVGLGSTQPTTISGLTTTKQYYVLKEDNNSFRVCDAGVGGTSTTDFEQENFVRFTTTGTGFQQFKYPDIQVSAQVTTVGVGTDTQVNNIVLTPVVKGEIEQVYLYEPGTGYGSDILNLEKKPTITIKNGRDAQFAPIIVNGAVNAVNVQFSGFDYFSVPEVVVHDPTGSGTGARLRAVVSNEGKISDIKIINAGIGYSTSSTIQITPSGKNQQFDFSIRSLFVNQVEKLSTQQLEILKDVDNELSYSVTGYFETLRNSFQDDGSTNSGIIGWAYDGNPIYGSYSPPDAENISSGIKTMTSSYVQSASNIYDRPSTSTFPLGFFVDDYRYENGIGDLDRNNGRFAKTQEFPNGVYAYYASIDPTSGNPQFPYFIGDTFRSNTLSENPTLDQTFDFNASSLSRNTLPYKISELEADNDFIIESNEIKRQKISVESVQEGSVKSLKIINSGDNYKVNDSLVFDNTNTNGGGISAEISELKGKTVNRIDTTKSTGLGTLVWRNDGKVEVVVGLANYFGFIKIKDNDYVLIDDIKRQYSSTDTTDIRNVTDESSKLSGYHKVDFINIPNVGLTTEIKANSGVTTEIYVTSIPPDIENYLAPTDPSGSGGSTIGIGTEVLEILNVYRDKNIIRVHRGKIGTAHTVGMAVTFNLTRFTIDADVDYFESRTHQRVNFNPVESVGIGTTAGIGVEVTYSFGNEIITGSVPTQRISLPDHPFKTNDKLVFDRGVNSIISISTSPTGTPFALPSTVYAVNKTPNTIGIKTTLNSDEVFFRVNGDDVDDYYFQKNYDNVIATISKINSTVSVSTAHGLSEGDLVTLNVKPNLSVGIGTSTAVVVKRNSTTGNLEINQRSFENTGVNTITSEITLTDHGFETGDKVFYNGNMNTTEYETDGVTSNPGTPLSASAQNALTDKAIGTGATKTAQQIYDYFWANYAKYDMDGDGVVSENDALILMREAFSSFPGNALISGITFPSNATRTTAADIRSFITSNGGISATSGTAPFTTGYDIDGNGTVTSLSDMLMVQRIVGGTIGAPDSYPSAFNTLGLETDYYYVHKVDSDTFNLSESLINSKQNPPVIVSIAYTGGNPQNVSLINPRIESVVNNNLVFDLSDSSLSGYAFKVYYDQDFNNEFVSTGSTSTFSTVSVGTTGLAGATYTLNHSSGFPERLYYSLEKSGYISTSDKDVNNYSEILFVDSLYNQTYPISGVGTTTFQVSLQEIPEKLSYLSTECDNLEYTTTSLSASGPVNRVKLLSGGSEYKKLPSLSDVTSTNGDNLFVSLESNDIGNILETRIINEGFEYSSDKTLQPEAFISPKIQLKDSNTIGIVTITSGGSGYITPPQITIVNSDTRNVLDNGLIKPTLTGSSITDLSIEVSPKGISDQSAELFATSNTNGVSVTKVDSSNTGIFTCTLTTPPLGFTTTPFAANDEVFVEGIQKYSTTGDGFNSSDYGFKFFTVTDYNVGLVEDTVTLSIAGLGTNTGIAKTIQDSFGTIISRNNYPSFTISLKSSAFDIGETLISDNTERDLVVTGYSDGLLKVFGSYDLSVNEVITGKTSGNVATIESLDRYDGMYEIKFSNRKDEGWETETGKLSEDYQIIADNDYYQNLSYSVKSRQQWKDIRTPVNSLVHSVGIKNFSDTEIMSDDEDKIGISSFTDETTIVRDFIDQKRVDTINNFDFTKDVDLFNQRSKFLKLVNKKLTNFNESRSNIVLKIDNIQDQFSSFESEPFEYKDLVKIDDLGDYNNYLFKVSDISNRNQVQLTNLVFLKNSVNGNNLILEKQSLSNIGSGLTVQDGDQYGDFSIVSNEFGESFLRFTPVDPFDIEYDIKYIYKKFTNNIIGVGTQSVGFIDLTSRSQVSTTGTASTVIGIATDKFTSLHISAQVYKGVSNDANFVELYLTHDGTNTAIADYYFDTDGFSRSSGLIGSFGATIDSGIVNLNFNNDTNEDVVVKTNIVGFGTTSVGVGTYRYILPNQPAGNERSAIYQSDFAEGTGVITFLTLDKNTFDASKSLVEVSIGSTKSIHQIMMVQDTTNVYVQQSGSLSIYETEVFDTTSGIGTFGGEFSGNNVLVKFYPDASYTGDFKISSFSECLYTTVDFVNQAPNLEYGTSIETVNTAQYLAINGDRINKEDFVLNSNSTPIFAKKFNPANTQVLNQSTGVFSIDNHFFSHDEELIYTPGSTFVGVGSTAMMYKNGSVIAELPTQVFAVVNNNDNQFSISTTKSGTAVTFTSLGEGNSHEFAMAKRNEKAIITLDNVAQYPIAFTKISQTLAGNGGGITTTATTFALSGIATVTPLDILRIDDEYMKVVNVGFGTTNIGPITNTGTEKLVNVIRGHVGSSATSHTDSTTTRIYRGSYNIVGDSVFFTKAPRGNSSITRTAGNLEFETSDFTGRVFLRKDYTTNQIYDDVSEEFSGIGRTFTLTVGGANTIGIGTTGGNGIVFLNGIFQAPTTENNPSNNFKIIEQTSPTGITSIVFSGIRTDIADPNSILVSESDVNQNQIPRGGVIISIGSTGGLGYAPLVGASVTAVVGSTGNIVSVGLGVTDNPGSGYNGLVAVGATVVDVEYNHRFVSSVPNSITDGGGGTHTATNAVYNSVTGDLVLTIPSHGLTTSDTIGINDDGLVFTCSKDGYASNHSYPRAVSKTKQRRGLSGGDPIRGLQVSIAATTSNTVQINVGPGGGAGTGAVISASVVNAVGAGGSLSFTVSPAGSGYVNPEVFVSEPTYENLQVVGVSRIGEGATTNTGTGLLLNVNVGASSTVGVGSTYHSVNSFSIARSGYAFRKGDVFKPVGLVTAAGLASPLSEFELTVLEVFNDNFGAWQFGELDYIDSIKNFQDGSRIRFPLFYNGSILSFEKPEESNIVLENVLLIFLNGVLQEPGEAYTFDGGTSFAFSVPPKSTDLVDIFFYRGTRGQDDIQVENVIPTLERGDDVQVFKNDTIPSTVTQDGRVIFDVSFSDKFETSLYIDQGVDEVNPRPMSWTKQKVDREVNGEFVYKTRQSTISQVYPTAKIIKDIATSDSRVFVDDVSGFTYNLGGGPYNKLSGIIVDGDPDPSPANITATIGAGGVVSSLTIANGGNGYTGSTANIEFQNPLRIDDPQNVGFGTTATATATITNGVITGTTIVNPGFGYTVAPKVIVPLPDPNYEILGKIEVVSGFSGIITSIETTSGTGGHPLAIKFHLDRSPTAFGNDLKIGYPIFVKNTKVGNGVITVDGSDSAVVGIGTTFLDNVYYIGDITTDGTVGIITCNINSATSTSGLTTSGDMVGEFSWGLFTSITRQSSPISIGVTGKTVDVGLSTFPTIQRRGEGLRQTGALPETIN